MYTNKTPNIYDQIEAVFKVLSYNKEKIKEAKKKIIKDYRDDNVIDLIENTEYQKKLSIVITAEKAMRDIEEALNYPEHFINIDEKENN